VSEDEPLNLAIAAQDAGAQRLNDANLVLAYEDNEPEISHQEYQTAAAELAAPYCGCTTCVVREVIDAAWPYLSLLAVEQFRDALNDPGVRNMAEGLESDG
jgi:hypothetical protein